MFEVAVLVGSLRKDSINRKLAHALEKLARDRLSFKFVELGDVPLYNEDLWQDPPAGVLRLKAEIDAADAVLLVTPEYNRSVPAVMKNAVDWANRPSGQNSWNGKPAAIVGTSPGVIGTAVAQAHLRHVMLVVGTILMTPPEVYLVTKPGLIDENLDVTDEQTRAFLEGWIERFEDWIGRVAPKP